MQCFKVEWEGVTGLAGVKKVRVCGVNGCS